MTPVVIIVYNRPALTRNLVTALRRVQPPHVLVVADGAKPGDPRDADAVSDTRAELTCIDWPCQIDYNYADSNLGCSQRVRSGLDWVFTRVDRAIVLEDDIDPHPSLFDWMGRMLTAYRDRDDVAMLCGHNPLVVWRGESPSTCAVPSRRGGVWGWATWSRAWQAVQNTPIQGSLETIDAEIEAFDFEPALAGLYRTYLHQARSSPLSWDVDWTLRMAMSRRIALVSPTNLVHHLGLGPDATHHQDSDDTLFVLPRLPVRWPSQLQLLPVGADDRAFDRARVLLELLVRARQPRVARQLARHPRLPLDPALQHHLLPFAHPHETATLLQHLRAEGLDSERFQRWWSAFDESSDVSGRN